MSSTLARLAFVATAAWAFPTALAAEPFKVVREGAKDEAPARVEAAIFDLEASLFEAASLNGLLTQSGVDAGEAASAVALAETQVDDRDAVLVKLGLSRNPDNGTISLQRMTLSTADRQTVFEQRDGKLRVVSSATRKLRII